MDHPLDPQFTTAETLVRPWRTATLLVTFVAALELVLLVVLGGALLVRGDDGPATPTRAAAGSPPKSTKAKAAAGAARALPAAKPSPNKAAAPGLARSKVRVLVLNGNGVTGAAAREASRVRGRGYRISAVTNAPRMDYTRSLVMYRKGFAGEAQRLARDLRVPIVGPLDGLRKSEVGGAHVVLVVGSP